MNNNFHVTVKGVLIKNDEILLVKRTTPSSDGFGYWELPGGGVDFGESPEQALIREFNEETGLQIEIQKPIYTFTTIRENYQTIGIGFLISCPNKNVVLSDEHTDYQYVNIQNIHQFLNENISINVELAYQEYKKLNLTKKLKS